MSIRMVEGRATRAERNHTKQAEAEWLTAEELGKLLHVSGPHVREILCNIGHGCRESKKPTKEAFRTGLARRFRHHGRVIYKWNRKMIIPELKESLPDN